MADFSDAKAAIDAIKISFNLFRDAIGLARDVESTLPDGEKKRAIEESLERADVSSRTAEAQIALALGYLLCLCIFPPSIMLSIGLKSTEYSPMEREHFKCPNCGIEKVDYR